MKSIEVPIKARSTPASLSFKGQATKHTTVKWSINVSALVTEDLIISFRYCQRLNGYFD